MNRYSKLSKDELELHFSNYLMDSWSYSKVSCFSRNEKAFEMQYIYCEKEKRSASSIAGNAYHKAMEYYFQNLASCETIDLCQVAYDYLDAVPANDWKLTDKLCTVELAVNEALSAVNAYIKNFCEEISEIRDNISKVLGTEVRLEEWVTVNGVEIPLPCHAVLDLVVETVDGKRVIIDHKSKSKFTDPDEVALVHGQQGITYVVAWESAHPDMPIDEVWFLENKRSANRDGSPQLRCHAVQMDADTRRLYEVLLYEPLRRMIEAVSDPDYIYTINNTDNLSDRARLYEFWTRTLIAEVDDFENIPDEKREAIRLRQRKIKDSSLASVSPKVITSFRRNAASFITFDYSRSNMTNSEKIEHAFRSFSLQVKVAHEIEGFSCNTYLCEAAAGIKLADLKKYAMNIANALDVPSVRFASELVMYEGKSYLSIEVNKKRTESLDWDAKYLEGNKIPIGLDNFRKLVVWDLDNHSTPHMLVCGASGSGKSVSLRSTIEYAIAAGITDIKIFDPKYEFVEYAGIPTVDVYNEVLDIENEMAALVSDMNVRVKHGTSHRTLVIFDEYADVISQARKGKELDIVEKQMNEKGRIVNVVVGKHKSLGENLQILLQKGRSSGFRILAATQRASVKVISGDAKVNFPALVCFRVPKSADSRVVIDEDGAESLAGYGDGLIKTPEYLDQVVRFQGFYKA